uniref:Receptor-like serine/threonine-protein kinase n=1 Tax=Glycine max TaxID=3847 RepID=K7LUW1_SOYBN
MLLIWFFLFSYMTRTSTSVDHLAASRSIRDSQILVSAGNITALGFFSPGNSTRRYLGIWFRKVHPFTVVWVANRNTPLENESGVLKLNKRGILELLNGKNSTIWSSSSNKSSKAAKKPIAQLRDLGNLVVINGPKRNTKKHKTNNGDILWQSFDYPGDTLMPGMKLGWTLENGLERSLSSWKNWSDPAEGEYTLKVDRRGYPQIILFRGPDIKRRLGSWNGLPIVGYPTSTHLVSQKFVFHEKEVYYEYKVKEKVNRSVFNLYNLNSFGTVRDLFWSTQNRNRRGFQILEQNQCEDYAFCGVNSICNYIGKKATCKCVKGYSPKSPSWNSSTWSRGCVPPIPMNKSNCKNSYTEEFWKNQHMKFPDTSSSLFIETMDYTACKIRCRDNCSCVAYANISTGGGTGCLLWFNELVDLSSNGGQDLYTKIPAPVPPNNNTIVHPASDPADHRNLKIKTVAITVGVTTFGLIIIYVWIWIIKNPGAARKFYKQNFRKVKRMKEIDLPTFDLSVLANATENFSSKHKLGEGGFGPVYKIIFQGTLIDGKVIAVKRLSKKSKQGLDELKNEVALIAKLQHRNLVKLLGCCIEGEEKMLIYEYMPNLSLDCFLFDETKKKLLDWPKRFNIISGITRGLVYLHQDSRLRIIHRDLKTSNILLDDNLDPKISDFGLARSFLEDQVEANTNRVAGTCGYMPPEYAAGGRFSVKSDVFSYGVIVLEIVSGKRNTEFANSENYNNILGHAWTLWTEDRALELLDDVVGEQCKPYEVIRCIQVGLLCVQQRPQDRPHMSSVLSMLSGDKLLPKPMAPGFYSGTNVTSEATSSSANHKLWSVNEASITELDAR